ncbi:unnamed protein product [Cunninghamella blakesleeana]
MDDLANELILHIFSFLSQRQIKRCCLVNKKWNQLGQDPQSYKSIFIYSESQLGEFINHVKNKKIADNNKPLGHYVQQLHYYGRNLSSALFTSFHQVCPNITFINEIDNIYSDESTSPLLSLPQWQYLNHFNTSYTYHYKDWMKHLKENKKYKQIKTLSFYLDMDKLDSSKKKLIKFEKDTRRQKRKLSLLKMSPLTQVFQQRINTYFDIKSDYVYHYGKILMLPKLKLLTFLSLDFSTYAMKTVYDLDQRTLESIMSSCPRLESLIIRNMEMNISDDYYEHLHSQKRNNNITTSTFTPSMTLIHLSFINCNLHDPTCYDYLSLKFPKLKTFSLTINRDDIYPNREYPKFKTAIFYMITHFIDLTSLTLKINRTISQINDQFWPIQELQDWLNHSSSTLLHLDILDYYMDISHNDLTKSQIMIPEMVHPHRYHSSSMKNRLYYLNYLKSFTLTMFTNTATTILSYLLKHSIQQQIISYSITSLNLDTYLTNSHHHYNTINLFQWLNSFPNLKKLTLVGMNRITDESEYRHHEINSNNNDNNNMNHYSINQLQQYKYKLTELKIHDSSIDINGGLSTLCNVFLHLTTLDLKNVTFQNDIMIMDNSTKTVKEEGKRKEKEINNDDEESRIVNSYNTLSINDNDNNKMITYVIDATHLNLDLLSLMYISYQSDMAQENEMELCSFTIEEMVGSQRAFHFSTIPDIIPFHLHFKCKSLEGLII